MVTQNLDRIFNPKSVAVIGASNEEGSVGYVLIKNLTGLGYEGKVYPVNIRETEILGFKAYKSVDELPETVDLAVIATPAKTVPEIIEPDGKSGEIAFIVADPWQGLGLGSKMLDHMIEICKDKKLETIYGIMLGDNYRAINLMKKMGFAIEYLDDGTVKGTLNLKEEEPRSRHVNQKREE